MVFKNMFALVFIFLLFGTVAFGADAEYRFTHNDHETLIIGEITAMDSDKMVIRAEDYIVSKQNLNINNKKNQLRPQTVTVIIDDSIFFEDKKVGDYVIASLNRNGLTEFDVAWGIYNVDSLDYKTLNVFAHNPVSSAMLTDFVNSGGEYTEFVLKEGSKVIRRYDENDTVIYQDGKLLNEQNNKPFEQPTNISTTAFTNNLSEQQHSFPVNLDGQFKHLKYWINNTGNHPYILTVTKDSGGGPPYGIYKVPPGKFTVNFASLPAGMYFANLTCGPAKMSGVISCRIAMTRGETKDINGEGEIILPASNTESLLVDDKIVNTTYDKSFVCYTGNGSNLNVYLENYDSLHNITIKIEKDGKEILKTPVLKGKNYKYSRVTDTSGNYKIFIDTQTGHELNGHLRIKQFD